MLRNLKDTQGSGKYVNTTTTDSKNGCAFRTHSESSTGGTGCLNWARPRSVGVRVGDYPVLPSGAKTRSKNLTQGLQSTLFPLRLLLLRVLA